MDRIDMLTNDFRSLYERFLIGCDAIEETGGWDKENLGEMDVFYENDLLSLILRLIAADGKISEKEAEYLDRNFGFDYSPGQLADIYENCREAIGGSFDEKFKEGVRQMKAINAKLADAYAELLGLACDIVAASDGEIAPEEIEEAKRIKALL